MSVNFLAISVPFEPDDFAVIFGIYPIDRTSVGVLLILAKTLTSEPYNRGLLKRRQSVVARPDDFSI